MKISAKELLDKLEKDPEWVARRDAQELEIQENELKGRLEERELVEDLAAVGVQAGSAWDLVNRANDYDHGIPVLIKHLHRNYTDRTKEGIARALAIPAASAFWSELVDEFKKAVRENQPDTTMGLAVALGNIIRSKNHTDKQVEEALEIIEDPQFGPNRLLILIGFRRRKSEVTPALIEKLRFDPDLSTEISKWG